MQQERQKDMGCVIMRLSRLTKAGAVILSFVLASCAIVPEEQSSTFALAADSPSHSKGITAGISNPELAQIVIDFTNHERKFDPAVAAEFEGRLPSAFSDDSLSTKAEKTKAERHLLEQLQTGPMAKVLTQNDQVNADILASILIDRVELAQFDPDRIPFIADSGCHTEPLYGPARALIGTLADAKAVLESYSDVTRLFNVCIANMKRGLAGGVVAHIDVAENVLKQIRDLADDEIGTSPFLAPFIRGTDTLDQATRAALVNQGIAAVEKVLADYKVLVTFFETEYLPQAGTKAGLGSVPNGESWYRALARYHTSTTDADPMAIHALGLNEVARIRSLMAEVQKEAGFTGSLSEFLVFLRTDPQFYAKSGQELIDVAGRHAKRIDAGLPRLFGVLPRLPFTIEPVPEAIAPGYTTARYIPGDPALGRAGVYWVNTYRLDQRPLFELPALTAHEANPGHHFQITLAQELQQMPWFRRQYGPTAFIEGWGLYAETLGEDLGIYTTPYEQFGRLSYEMWRACRLVADTGLHALGWTREQAEACFLENSALSELNIDTEVTRYIGWPGQALAYKVGELEIRRLRSLAAQELGERFDLRVFHDRLLSVGALPMATLTKRMEQWIQSQKLNS